MSITRDFLFKAGGETGELVSNKDWSNHPLGPIETWPDTLKSAANIIFSTPFPMMISWGKDHIQLYNDGYRPILGSAKHPQAMGACTKDTFPEIWDIVGPMFEEVWKGNPIRLSDFFLPLNKHGYLEDCYFDFSYSPVYESNGEVGGILVTCIETTENIKNLKKLSESNKALKNSEENLNNLVSHAPVAMAVLKGPDFEIKTVNEKVLEIWGKTYEQVINKPIFKALPEVEGQGIDLLLNSVYQTGERFVANELEVELLRKGELQKVYLNFVYEALRNASDEIYGIAAVAIEVTDEVVSRQKVEEAEERARLAIDAADIGTFDFYPLTEKLVTSARFDLIMGSKKSESRDIYIASIHPDDHEIRNQAFKIAYKTGKLHYIVRVIDNNKIKWVQAQGQVYFDTISGKPNRVLGTMLDITEQRLVQQQKDDFMSIASHELKTPLTSLKAYLQILKKSPEVKDFSVNLADNSLNQVKRLENLIADLLDVSKISSGKLVYNTSVFNFADLIRETVVNIQITSSTHQLIITGNPDAKLEGDRDRLEQVLINYLTNAIKYSPGADKVEIHSVVSSGKLIVSIRDFGVGIEPENLNKIFDRFYRVDKTSMKYEGLGLGLYVASEIVSRHNGSFWIESELNKGSSFFFMLPLIDEAQNLNTQT